MTPTTPPQDGVNDKGVVTPQDEAHACTKETCDLPREMINLPFCTRSKVTDRLGAPQRDRGNAKLTARRFSSKEDDEFVKPIDLLSISVREDP